MRDLQGLGTAESTWRDAGLPDTLAEVDWEDLLPVDGKVVLVVPHPDDEVLGVGGILLALARRRVPVLLLAVTDGEKSHPGREDELRVRRAQERSDALAVLGSDATVRQLRHPDGGIDEQLLRKQLSSHVEPADVVIAPWPSDGHPDHDVCGRAAEGLGARTWSYLVWAWHWATPEDLPLPRAVRVPMTQDDLLLKRRAVSAYVSQIEGDDAILPLHVTVRLLRSCEVLVAG